MFALSVAHARAHVAQPKAPVAQTGRHWLRGLVIGVAIALVGLLLIRDLEKSITKTQAFHSFEIDAGGSANHGEAITVDLPASQHQANIAVRGLGCCVFRSLDHAARYQNVPALIHMPEWMQQKGIAGGGYPEKVAKLIPQCAADRGLPVPDYVQHTGGDMAFLRLALKTGRFVSVTYAGHDGVFYRGSIAHMVNLVHLSDQWAVILDNNNPGKYLWLSVSDFEQRWKEKGGGWAVVLLAPPPPPMPRN